MLYACRSKLSYKEYLFLSAYSYTFILLSTYICFVYICILIVYNEECWINFELNLNYVNDMYNGVCVCVCVCSRKRRQSGIVCGFTPGNWAYTSNRAYARFVLLAR